MLKKRLRLRAAEVEEVLKKGHSVRSAHMHLKWLSSSESMRSAAVVAKATARKATARNTLRRAIYKAISTLPSPASLPKGKGVFFLRVIPKDAVSAVVREEVAFLLSKIK